MAVLSVSIVLVASYPEGRNVGRSDFVDMLATPPTDRVAAVTFDEGPWASSKIEFLNRQLHGYQSHAEPATAFFEEIQKTLTDVARWIDDRKAPLKNARESGLEVSLLLDMVIDQDQLDLILPAAILRAAGEAGIPVQVITNE